MIFEMRTYLLKPGTVPQAEAAFDTALPGRVKLSRLGGFWRTEVGLLNQIIHIWPYDNTAERDRIRAEAIATKVWPPKIADFVLDMQAKILYPAPFSPHFEPGEHGNLYEFRTYTFGPGGIPKVIEAWSPKVAARAAHSPLIFAGYTEIGPLNQWVHVWAYKNMGERERLRGEATKSGLWPPPRDPSTVVHRQESTFAIPAKFSPLR